ncbi:MAG: phospholipid transport system substrate-binding protein [Parasphingorhabdus sp.]|jgi:phospholipid transport system substrate-binding protein
MKFYKLFISFLLVIVISGAAEASTLPDVLVEKTINDLIGNLEARRGELKEDRQKLYQMVEDVLVPHFDIEVIARLVLAKHWRKANDNQKMAFAAEFKNLLIRTYATALFEYTGNEKLIVKPLRMKDGDRKVQVKTEVILPGAPPVPVNYSFLQNKSGDWKIYDVKIDGISLVTNYRSSYGQKISADGLDSLINALREKSQKLGSS